MVGDVSPPPRLPPSRPLSGVEGSGTPVIRGHTPSWVRPGTDCIKLHSSVGRTRGQ
jgi:hypothetical protein